MILDHYEMRQAYLRALEVQQRMLEQQQEQKDDDEQKELQPV